LLSNLYLRRFILGWKELGYAKRFQAEIVSYADDFVVCCRTRGTKALEAVRAIVQKLKLQLNEEKTQLRKVPQESVDFLGYTLGRCYSRVTGKAYIGTRPSRKRVQRICQAISESTSSRRLLLEPSRVVTELNRQLTGWSRYFCLGQVSPAYAAVDAHARKRLRQWLRRKYTARHRPGVMRFPDEYLYDSLGLIRLEPRTRNLPWAKA
jgi:hypothetical protein